MLTNEQWQKLTPEQMLELLPLKAKFAQKKAKIMSEVKRIAKSGYNSFHKYQYATEADVKDQIRGILFENGISFDVNLVEHSKTGDITTAVLDCTMTDTETGYFETRRFVGDGQDKNDKGIYKAYAGGIKYFLMTTFLIPTGDDPEQDERPQQQKPPKNEQNRGKEQPKPQSNTNSHNGSNVSVKAILGGLDELVKIGKDKKKIEAELDKLFGVNGRMYKDLDNATKQKVLNQLNEWVAKAKK